MTTPKRYVISFTAMSLLNISACNNNSYAPVISKENKQAYFNTTNSSNIGGYICHDISPYKDKVVGSGECVDLIKRCSGAPNTNHWKPGEYVLNKDIPPGTAIATFKHGKYPNRTGYHAAIYSHQTDEGIYVWDQWRGKAVHLRLIKANQFHKDPGNNANHYRVIRN